MPDVADLIYHEDEQRYQKALAEGPLGFLQLRADWLLKRVDADEIEVTYDERVELERISAAPHPQDFDLLGCEFEDRIDDWAAGRKPGEPRPHY